ncbi:MAG TPA: hypothetical protein VLA52_08410 [Thermohalobaculum sp.]|nr:hypothetical protein [Thermohalobaculum sp.]
MAQQDHPHATPETVPPGEAGEIEELATLTTKLQDARAKNDASQNGRVLRGVHPKSHGCVEAEFAVREDIDKKYRVGLFAHPGKTYSAWIRFSNASVLREHDLKGGQNGSRGMAIKVLGVKGKMLERDNGQKNQDFLMINTPQFAFANVRDYLRLERILERDPLGADPKPYFIPAVLAQLGQPKDGEPAEISAKRQFLQSIVTKDPLLNKLTPADLMGTIASAKVAAKIAALPVRNPMQVQYFGAAPFLFGPGQVMKFSAAPVAPKAQAPFDPNAVTPGNPPENYLAEALTWSMSGTEAIKYDFMIQTRSFDDEGLNIEDATTTWPDEEANYVPVARITIRAPQSPNSRAVRDHCERLAFSPWHGLADHKPLGGINRMRQQVYSSSAEHRGAGGT